MKLLTSGSKLIIEASVSAKDTFLHLGVGIVFLVAGLFLVNASGQHPMTLIFPIAGVLALISLVVRLTQTRRTYTFDRSTQQLYLNPGDTIPFSAIENVRVRQDTWRGTYGESHSDHSVTLSAGNRTFSMPANSQVEARNIVNRIQQHLADSSP